MDFLGAWSAVGMLIYAIGSLIGIQLREILAIAIVCGYFLIGARKKKERLRAKG